MPGSLMVGRTVSQYEVREKLGAGGMGVVYKAYDTRLERMVALKFLPPHSSADPEQQSRFLHEARAASALDHPSITVIHEIVEDSDGQMFIAMQYCEGEPLKSKIARAITPAEAVAFGIQIARALDHAHRHGIVHRDIKPGNIIVTPEGGIKIIDFGLAKLRDATQTLGTTTGTLPYMSPEQTTGQSVDQRTDIWSLGAVLYEMLSGRQAFSGDAAAVMYAITHRDAPRLRDVRPDLPAALDQIVQRCLQKEVESRYSSAANVAHDLEAFAAPQPKTSGSRNKRRALMAAAVLVAIAAGWFIRHNSRVRWAHDQAIPQIDQLARKGEFVRALHLVAEVEKIVPDSPQLAASLRDVSTTTTIVTEPPGALVEFKEYAGADDRWTVLGTTPLKAVRVPLGHLRWRISKAGFAVTNAAFAAGRPEFTFRLDSEGSVPPDMVSVPSGRVYLNFAEFGGLGPFEMKRYFIDKFEVTNRQFKEFVDKGGYDQRQYWKQSFVENGRTLTWQEGMARFRDGTGRPGPATWEGGRYPEGQDEYPVGGVSWYEAEAYATFAGKSLPTIVHWYRAADVGSSRYIMPLSNLGGSSVAAVGKYKGLGTYGTYDMAGNVREWSWNEESSGYRFIFGGAWNLGAHLFSGNADTRPPFDRSPVNGFRCVKYTGEIDPQLLAPKPRRNLPDFTREKPVSDELFRSFLGLYSYDHTDLRPKLDGVKETRDWREERITINTAYENERMAVYIMIPKNATPPYQSVIYFSGAGAAQLNTSERLLGETHYGFLVKSGRAVVYPVYWGTYERSNERALQTTPAVRRERTIKWALDLRRTVDYLESREDLDKTRIAYAGHSQGGWVGPVLLAVESRIKTGILLDGGMSLAYNPPEVHPLNFAPRLTRPVLMLNGRYDFTFPYDKSQVPLLRLLGTPERDKRHVVYDTAHDVSVMRTEMIAEVLGWLDKYLGKVQ